MMEDRRKVRGKLTGNGAEVEVVSNNLLVVVVHGALGEPQVEVVPQILVNHPPYTQTQEERGYSLLSLCWSSHQRIIGLLFEDTK